MPVQDFLNKITCFNALDGQRQLPDKCIDMAITSPPYWGLRNYGDETKMIWGGEQNCQHEWGTAIPPRIIRGGSIDTLSEKQSSNKGSYLLVATTPQISGGIFCSKCGAWLGQLGLEFSVELYVHHLCDIFDETKRVLKDTGSLWVNIGDTYNNNPSNSGNSNLGNADALAQIGRMNRVQDGIPVKSQCCVPERFVIEMVNRGWIKRNTIIWHKPNAMPSSVEDRFTVDFEYLFLFTTKPHYYFEQQLEPYRWGGTTLKSKGTNSDWDNGTCQNTLRDRNMRPNPAGRNKRCVWDETETGIIALKDKHGNEIASASVPISEISNYLRNWTARDVFSPSSVWSINTRPSAEAHFAVFPPELIETPIKAGCPKEVCNKCSKPRENIYSHNKLDENGEAGVIKLNDKPYSVQEREGFIATRNLPQLNILKDYLTSWRKAKGITIEKIEEVMQSQAPHHWFSGESYPTKEDWIQIKKLLDFDDKLDEVMTKEYFKPAEKMPFDYTVIGRTDCGCGAGYSTGVVLDMFMGSGTVAVMAKELGVNFIGFDINADYVNKIAIPRINRIRGSQKTLGAF